MRSWIAIALLASSVTACAEAAPSSEESMLKALVETEFRSTDGSGNNVENPDWGRAETPLVRLARAAYSDGLSSPAGADRPSARLVSDIVVAQPGRLPNGVGASDFLWAWGQFVDHDIDLTTTGAAGESFDIPVPPGDPYFDPQSTGTQTIPMSRSDFVVDADGVRQQVNFITTFLDASTVYGSDEVRAAALRTLDGTGRLKMGPGRLLPRNVDGLPNAESGPVPSQDFFLAGDIRANEVTPLTTMHTLFVREHNRLATLAAAVLPELSGDEIYQLARRLVSAEIQSITYREFLPLLLGQSALPAYQGYRPDVDPSISNEFSTAAYRIGHTMLPSSVQRLGADGAAIDAGPLPLRDAFFSPAVLESTGLDPILRGLAGQRCEAIDAHLTDDVRNFLFGPPGAGGFDLASLNIQRGRDHGLPSYNEARRQLGLAPAANFSDITSDPETAAALAEAYGSVDDVDLWVGGLAEDPMPGAMVGQLFQTILVDQFTRLRDGDRFWYQTLPQPAIDFVESSTLADVIRNNTGVGDELADNVFMTTGQPPAATLMINEVLADPGAVVDANQDGVFSSTQDEFVEIVNVGDAAADVSGAVLSDAVGPRLTLPAGTVVAPGQALVIFGGGQVDAANFPGAAVVAGTSTLYLNNGGDSVTLSSAGGETLAELTFGRADDQSLVRAVELDPGAAMVPHRSVSDAAASPGTRADGTPF